MIAGSNSPDGIDGFLFEHLDAWITLTWRDGPVRPPKGVPYGTHLASFLYCGHGEEIRGLNLCWLVESSPGQFYRTGEFQHGMDATWLFRYSTLRKYELAAMARPQVYALELPFLNLGDGLPPGIGEFRRRRDLDRYRHPGFPDDLSSGYGGQLPLTDDVSLTGEQLWVRVKRVISLTEFESELLNSPTFFEGAAGDTVSTRIVTVGETSLVFSFPRKDPSRAAQPNERCT